jgi:serine-type D-Ala-D-Ala carboxypeptidase/endopeptidase (penicillin-binding protein 4)
MKNFLFSVLFISLPVFLAGQTISPKITFSKDVFPDNASWSIFVVDALTGEVISDKDGTVNLIPASVMKLIPTAAALNLLGGDYRFTTSLAFTGRLNRKKGELDGNIIIIGGGDPMLGSPNYSDIYGDVAGKWVNAIKEAGIKKIKGNIVADASIYDYQPVPGAWEWDDAGNYYGAGIHGLNFMNNSFNIYLHTGNDGTTPSIDSTDAVGRYLKINNYLVTKGTTDLGCAYSAPYEKEITLGGIVPANSQMILNASLPDPPLATAIMLKERLASMGISVSGTATTRRTTISNDTVMEMLSTTISPTLKEMITTTNQESINLFAGQLCKHLGLVYRNNPSFEAGMEVITAFLDTNKISTEKVCLNDPSGLSRNNLVSAIFMTNLLRFIYNSPSKDIFISSMPVAGSSGTLKNYFGDELLKGRIIAKTGSMTGVRALSGYATATSGRVMAFTIIVNGYTSPGKEITASIEEIVKAIVINY